MHEDHGTWQRLHGLARLGVMQLESGRRSRETHDIVQECAVGLDLANTTMTNLGRAVVLQHTTPDGRALNLTREVAVSTGINCEKARELDEAAAPIAAGRVAPAEIESLLDDANAMRQRWYVAVLGLSLLAASIALQFGAGWSGALFAGVLEFVVAGCGVLLNRGRVALLFVVMAQAALGAGVALTSAASGFVPWVAAVAAVAVSWVILVPQPAVVTCALDAVDGEYPAAAARGAVVLMTLVGVAVAAGFFVGAGERYAPAHAQLHLPTLAWPLVIIFSGVGALANAFANGGGRRLVAPAVGIGMGTGALNLVLSRVLDVDAVVTKSIVAAVLGLVATLVAPRLGYPAAVLMLMGITGALLPGDVVYTGIMGEILHGSGLEELGLAGVICFGLGAGSAFGAMLTALLRRGRRVLPA